MKLIACITAFVATSCASASPSALDVSIYGLEQYTCLDEADARPAADACRASSRHAFCERFPTMPNCAEGGSHE